MFAHMKYWVLMTTRVGGGYTIMFLKFIDDNHVKVCNTSAERDWPRSSNLQCYYCCHGFNGPPIPWTNSYDDRRHTFQITTYTFCSWRCIKAFGHNSLRSRCSPISVLYNKLFGLSLADVPVAPCRTMLKDFGGKLTIEEFRRHPGPKVPPIRLPSGVMAVKLRGTSHVLSILYPLEQPPPLPVAPPPNVTSAVPAVPATSVKAAKSVDTSSQKKPVKKATTNHNILSLLVKKPKAVS